jgi:hypothetical protein
MIVALTFLGSVAVTILAAIVGDLVSEEVRGWLDLLPQAVLRFAANMNLDPFQYILVYEDEWMPELTYILKGAEYRPITRLIVGMHFSLSLLFSRMTIETSQPATFTVTPKDERIIAILESISSRLDDKPKSSKSEITFRYGRFKRRDYALIVDGVAISPDTYREVYKAGMVLLFDIGHGHIVPMTMNQFEEIAKFLELGANLENRNPD